MVRQLSLVLVPSLAFAAGRGAGAELPANDASSQQQRLTPPAHVYSDGEWIVLEGTVGEERPDVGILDVEPQPIPVLYLDNTEGITVDGVFSRTVFLFDGHPAPVGERVMLSGRIDVR